MIGLSLACAISEMGPVLPMVTTISMEAPTATIPEFEGKTLINGFACPNTCSEISVIVIEKSIGLINFIFIFI